MLLNPIIPGSSMTITTDSSNVEQNLAIRLTKIFGMIVACLSKIVQLLVNIKKFFFRFFRIFLFGCWVVLCWNGQQEVYNSPTQHFRRRQRDLPVWEFPVWGCCCNAFLQKYWSASTLLRGWNTFWSLSFEVTAWIYICFNFKHLWFNDSWSKTKRNSWHTVTYGQLQRKATQLGSFYILSYVGLIRSRQYVYPNLKKKNLNFWC